MRRQIGVTPMDFQTNGSRTGNSFLDSLREGSRHRLQSMSQATNLVKDQVLSQAGRPSTEVFFPVHCIISAINLMSDGTAIEVGVAGHEGMSSLSIAFDGRMNTNTSVVQAAGSAFCMSADAFADELRLDPHLRERMTAYIEYSFCAAMQFAACNRCHSLHRRYARSLLMTLDRIGANALSLTHEDSAEILGVRRAGVTVAASALSAAGMITYRRGSITVLDRELLEHASCECYGIVNAHLYRCMGYGARQTTAEKIAARAPATARVSFHDQIRHPDSLR
jgi:CRP-like cAMP-binding protein